VSGLVTMAGLVGYSLSQRPELPSWLVTAAVAGGIGAALPIVCAIAVVWQAAGLHPRVEGPVGDVFDDLRITRMEPWLSLSWLQGLSERSCGLKRPCVETPTTGS
jgi:hypothetical protein